MDEPAVEELATTERCRAEIKPVVERLTVVIENGEAAEPGRLALRHVELVRRQIL